MGGYIARSGLANGVHDRLHVRAVAFRWNDTAAILLALDLLHISHEWAQRLRDAISHATGVSPQNILAAATHTHSGPAVFSPIIGKTETLVKYEEDLLSTCIGAAADASTRFVRRTQTWAELERLGKRLARSIIKASKDSEYAEEARRPGKGAENV
jgi:neutral ceramidase